MARTLLTQQSSDLGEDEVVRRHAANKPMQDSTYRVRVDGFVIWRGRLEQMLRTGGDMVACMHAINHVAAYRRDMAPDECPDCGGRGMWVDQGSRNCYCARCTGTGILLVCEQNGSKAREPVPARWRSWLQGLGHLNLRRNMTTRRRS
jgi:hypothetical protein